LQSLGRLFFSGICFHFFPNQHRFPAYLTAPLHRIVDKLNRIAPGFQSRDDLSYGLSIQPCRFSNFAVINHLQGRF